MTFYRIVGHNPPLEIDFYSEQRLGRKPIDPDSLDGLEGWMGISVYETAARAKEIAEHLIRKERPAGNMIAELTIPDQSAIRGRKFGGRKHWNLFCDPSLLIACNAQIIVIL